MNSPFEAQLDLTPVWNALGLNDTMRSAALVGKVLAPADSLVGLVRHAKRFAFVSSEYRRFAKK